MVSTDSSVRAGVQQGLFGPRESQQLKEIAHSPALVASFASKGAQPLDALAATPTKPTKTSTTKKKAPTTHAGVLSEPQLRTMTNLPLELQRRSATRAVAALDIALSPFLLEKLPAFSGARSTPKQKLRMRLDANVVSLPKLPPPLVETCEAQVAPIDVDSNALATAGSSSLKTSASAPVLGDTSLSTALSSALEPEQQQLLWRSNIDRKLKLYEAIAGATAVAKPVRATMQRHSQPTLSTWQVTATESGGTRTRAEPSTPQMVMETRRRSAVSSGGGHHQPFGPFYTAKQVIEFGNILTRFDEDFSGDIDQQEWVTMLQSFRPIFGLSAMEATEKLFRSLDRDDSGRIGLHEILPAMVGGWWRD